MPRVSRKTCVYCGSPDGRTKDHIPPKNLFATPPANLITVPCCRACNNSAAKDDEYFRLTITIRWDAGDHAEAQKAIPKVLRSITRKESAGFGRAFQRSLRRVDVHSKGGIFLGTLPGYNVDLRRLNRVAQRIVQGLYYHEFGERLPETHHACAWSEDGLKSLDEAAKQRLREWSDMAMSQPAKTVGAGVFSYWVKQAEGDPYSSYWVLIFFEKVGFIALTGPKKLPIPATPSPS